MTTYVRTVLFATVVRMLVDDGVVDEAQLDLEDNNENIVVDVEPRSPRTPEVGPVSRDSNPRPNYVCVPEHALFVLPAPSLDITATAAKTDTCTPKAS